MVGAKDRFNRKNATPAWPDAGVKLDELSCTVAPPGTQLGFMDGLVDDEIASSPRSWLRDGCQGSTVAGSDGLQFLHLRWLDVRSRLFGDAVDMRKPRSLQ